MASYSVGVYAGNRVVKCVATKVQKGTMELKCKETYYYNSITIENDKYIAWVNNCIDKFIYSNGLRNYKVYLAYDMNYFIQEIGKLSEKEVEQSLVYQIQEKLNIADVKNNIKYNWAYTDSANSTNLIAVSALKSKSYEKFTRNTIINSIEDTSVSISRLINNSREPVVTVDMQKSNIKITMFINSLPVYSNYMNVDAKDTNITSNYMLEYKFDSTNIKNKTFEDKELISNNESITNESKLNDIQFDKKAMELEPVVSEITQFIRTSIFSMQLYFENKSIQHQIDEIYYTYDESLYSELIGYITNNIEVEFKPLITWDKLYEQFSIEYNEIQEYESYDLALGLAYLGKDEFSLSNLVFVEKNRVWEGMLAKVNIASFAGLMVILIGLNYFNISFNNLLQQAKYKSTMIESTLNNKQNELNQYVAVDDSSLKMDQLLADLSNLKDYNIDILDRLQESVVNSVALTDVVIDRNISIKGISNNYSDIALFSLALQRTYDIEISAIETEAVDNKYKFDIKVDIARTDYTDEYSVNNIIKTTEPTAKAVDQTDKTAEAVTNGVTNEGK